MVVDLDPDDGGSVNVRGQAEGFEVDRAFAADASQSDVSDGHWIVKASATSPSFKFPHVMNKEEI